MGWTVSLLPLPYDWKRAREILAPIARHASGSAGPPREELLDAVLESYRLTIEDVRELLSWSQ